MELNWVEIVISILSGLAAAIAYENKEEPT